MTGAQKSYVTVIATHKLDDKDKQVGIFFEALIGFRVDRRNAYNRRSARLYLFSGIIANRTKRHTTN